MLFLRGTDPNSIFNNNYDSTKQRKSEMHLLRALDASPLRNARDIVYLCLVNSPSRITGKVVTARRNSQVQSCCSPHFTFPNCTSAGSEIQHLTAIHHSSVHTCGQVELPPVHL